MKIKAHAEKLRDALGKILTVVDKKNSRPILTNCHISAFDNKLSISATDLEVSAKVIIEVDVEKPGSFCISAKNIFDILREMPDGIFNLEISESDNLLKLQYGQINFSLLICSTEDFPTLNFKSNENTFLLNTKDFQNIISKTSHAISTDETRLFLNGIFLQKIDSKLRSVAIDGHRLALLDKENFNVENQDLSSGIIIPRKGVVELKKVCDCFPNTDLEIAVDDSFVYLNANDEFFLSIRLIAREYPNYNAIIPSNTAFTLSVNKDLFLTAIKRVKLLASEKSNGIRFFLSPQKLTISANHPTLGEAKEVIDVDYEGKEINIGFNAKYIMDTFSVIEDEQISFGFNNELSPVLIRSQITPEFLGIIMPLKL